MASLKSKAQDILNEKTAKIIPENIKMGVNVFDIVGTNYYSFDPLNIGVH